ncbi:DgyrCDS13861 [Dimorphilus gyrociliatus]|uniref:DgyrCDS13861 n=1 Tax=Dimorphilus gyrociliatus TaxID=2664684 RepID=A0A7I8WC40_9ANNE|nr:DgyrCDS13861 [Dimorphilus gyrociliatus]
MAANGTTDTPTNPNSEAAQKWERPLNISDIKNEAKNWTLASDASMLLSLQNYSQKLVSRTHEVEKLLNTLIHETKMTNVRLDNTFNDFTMLANTQFVENPSREEVLDRVKTALNLGLSVLDTHFEKLQALGNSDSESGSDDESSRNPYFLEAKDPYIHRTLPHLIASQSFFKDENVGLTTTYSDDETDKEGNDYGSVSESEDSSSEDNEPAEDESEDEVSQDKNKSFEPESEDNDEEGIFKAVEKNDFAKESDDDEEDEEEDEEEKEMTNPRKLQKELSKTLIGTQSQNILEKKKKEKNKNNKIKSMKKEPVNLFSDEPPPFEDEDSPFAPSKGLFSTKAGLFDNVEDEDEDKDDITSGINSKIQNKNKIAKSSQLFDESDQEEDDLFINKTKKKSTANHSALTDTKSSNLKKKVTLSDDDDGDDSLFSDKKSTKIIPQKQQSKKIGLFDDDDEDDEIFKPTISSEKSQVGKKTVKNLFDDEDDDDEFSVSANVKDNKSENPKSIKSDTASKKARDKENSLFNVSNDEDDDMFNTKTVGKAEPKIVTKTKKEKIEEALSKPKRTATKKPEPLNLFDDDEDDDLFAAQKPKAATTTQAVQKKKTPNVALFQDENNDDDEDDLFSSKPSAKKTKSMEKKSLFLTDSEEEDTPPEKPKEELKKKIPVGGISVFGNTDMLKAAQKKLANNEEIAESNNKKEDSFSEESSDLFTSKVDKHEQEKQEEKPEKSRDIKEENEIENPLTKNDNKNKPFGGISVFGNSQLLNEAKSKIEKEDKKEKSDVKSKKAPQKGLFDEDNEDDDDDLFSGKKSGNAKKVEKTKLFCTDSEDDDILKSTPTIVKSNTENINKTTNDNKKLIENLEGSEVPKKALNTQANTRDEKTEVNTKQPSPKIKKSKPKQKSLFDDDSEDDLFIPKRSTKSNTKLQGDLFDDSEEELFKPKMSNKSAELFDSSADDDINNSKSIAKSDLLPPLPAKPQKQKIHETLEDPPPLPPRSPISSRSVTSDEERRKPIPRANKSAANKLPIQPVPSITVSSTDEDIPPPRPPRPAKFPVSKSSSTSHKTSDNDSEGATPPLPERRSNSPVPPKVTPRKKKNKQSDTSNSSEKSDKNESTAGSSVENDPLSGIEVKSPNPLPKPAKKPQMPKKEVNESKTDPFAAKQQNISRQLEALRGGKKPPRGAVSMFGPAVIVPRRDPNPVETSSSPKESSSPKLLGAENRDRIRVRPKDRRPPSRYIIMNDDSLKDVKEINKEEKKEDNNIKTIKTEILSKSDTEDETDIFDKKSNEIDNKKDVNLNLSNDEGDIFKKSLEKSLSPPSRPLNIVKQESDGYESDELFGAKVRNIPAVQVPKSKSTNESQPKKREIPKKPLKLDDSDDDIFKPKNSKTLIKKDSGDNLFEDSGKKNTKNLFESDDSDLDIFKRSPPKTVPTMDDDNEDDDGLY